VFEKIISNRFVGVMKKFEGLVITVTIFAIFSKA
jgi:hypothetical protein